MRASKSTTALFVLSIVAPAAAIAHGKNPPAPPGLVTIEVADGPFTIWPFTGTDLAGTASDPMNLVFLGEPIPAIRGALMALDGDRTAYGMPSVAPFNCTWTDAIGAPGDLGRAGGGRGA